MAELALDMKYHRGLGSWGYGIQLFVVQMMNVMGGMVFVRRG